MGAKGRRLNYRTDGLYFATGESVQGQETQTGTKRPVRRYSTDKNRTRGLKREVSFGCKGVPRLMTVC